MLIETMALAPPRFWPVVREAKSPKKSPPGRQGSVQGEEEEGGTLYCQPGGCVFLT